MDSVMTLSNIPYHVAIIMDGNGRWAKARGLPKIAGHQAGAKSVKEIVTAAGEMGIKVLTLYTFSTENWKRPKHEINALFGLLDNYISTESRTLKKNNIRFTVTGYIEYRALGDKGDIRLARARIARAIKREANAENKRLSTLVPFLATVGNTAPFIGLFGTVWGIMNSFHNIGLTQSASLAAVAPGISEALIATAAGLAAAIPAVIAFNYFTQQISIIERDLEEFSPEFVAAFINEP